MLTVAEEAERTRKFIEEEGPWNNGGKQAFCAGAGIAVPHDDLAKKMGDAYKLMEDSGFVMVPKQWRDDVFKALSDRAAAAREPIPPTTGEMRAARLALEVLARRQGQDFSKPKLLLLRLDEPDHVNTVTTLLKAIGVKWTEL